MQRHKDFVSRAIKEHRLIFLQEIVQWISEHNNQELPMVDFSLDPKVFIERLKSSGFNISTTNLEMNIKIYLKAISSNQYRLSLALKRGGPYVLQTIQAHRLKSLQKIIQWIIENEAPQLSLKDFNLEQDAFREKLKSFGLFLSTTYLEQNINEYLDARGLDKKTLSLNMKKDHPCYVRYVLRSKNLNSLLKVVRFISLQEAEKIQPNDFNLPLEQFREKLRRLPVSPE